MRTRGSRKMTDVMVGVFVFQCACVENCVRLLVAARIISAGHFAAITTNHSTRYTRRLLCIALLVFRDRLKVTEQDLKNGKP